MDKKVVQPIYFEDQAGNPMLNPEFKGALIDIFEDFLAEKGIEIPNPERDEYEGDDAAIIFGDDYDWIGDRIDETIRNFIPPQEPLQPYYHS